MSNVNTLLAVDLRVEKQLFLVDLVHARIWEVRVQVFEKRAVCQYTVAIFQRPNTSWLKGTEMMSKRFTHNTVGVGRCEPCDERKTEE